MNWSKRAACMTVFCLGASYFPARAGDVPSRPVGPAGHGDIVAFKEEPDTFKVETPHGSFQVVIEAGGRAARKALHAARSNDVYQGNSLEVVQKDFNTHGGRNGASAFLGFSDDGTLVGTFKKRESGEVRLFEYALNDDGAAKKVIVSGGKRDGEPAVVFRVQGAAGVDVYWIIATKNDSIVFVPDFKLGSK